MGDEDRRPWGHWIVTDIGDDFVVKRITINPGARLSLQYHQHREEIWTVVRGGGVAVVGDETVSLEVGQTVRVPVLKSHRMTNTGQDPLVFIEVQKGLELDEDDLVRLEDDYGRSVSVSASSATAE
ncbi:phosphomannose isomerase type II C-terminal cupin domain [Sneathiella chinensis]|uniref:phosphomannose isomerase type II C-terminal cupin domain n=1 Tax=Sneathiella chinensis TaxID=349750 RepID=UPI0024E0F03B|nr:phosphomannose isomerase type II C-terminal cupin domain [Sneathiella chinensis]